MSYCVIIVIEDCDKSRQFLRLLVNLIRGPHGSAYKEKGQLEVPELG
jgi:hypothetical protein